MNLAKARRFQKSIKSAETEEAVKAAYARLFDIPYNTKKHRDLITDTVLFEFKFNKSFGRVKGRAAALAQALYYIRRIKYSDDTQRLPIYICIANEKSAAFFEVAAWTGFYSSDMYDWNLTPSTPDPNLVKALGQQAELQGVRVFNVQDAADFGIFAATMEAGLAGKGNATTPDKKPITENNFASAYRTWALHFEEAVRNGFKPSKYFICDIQVGNSMAVEDRGLVQFQVTNHNWIDKPIVLSDYKNYWAIYDRVADPLVIRGIQAKADRLTEDDLRRWQGEFYTPLSFAKVALEHIEATIGKDWWNHGYRLWDMAAGTGNLEWNLPAEAWGKVYLSTLHQADADHCSRLFPGATTFQYDYLNDDVELLYAEGATNQFTSWKLPSTLRGDLSNPAIKWIILINPPFATSQDAGRDSDSKRDVSATAIRLIMHMQGLGAASRELFSQFVFRISKEFSAKKAHLGMFSKIKYLNAVNDAPLREKVFKFTFVSGFVFSSANFTGTSKSSQFPVGFLLWDLSKKKALGGQQVWVDVYNEKVEKTSRKQIVTDRCDQYLSKWISRVRTSAVMPPFSSAIEIRGGGPDVRDRVADGFLASLICKGNELLNQNYTALLSGPYVSAGAISVTAANFEKAMVVHAVRRIPTRDWVNDRDPLLQPNRPLSDEFTQDCVIWSLFSPSNATAAISNAQYQGSAHQIPNKLFPIPVADLRQWTITDVQIRGSLMSATDRFASQWIAGKVLSVEAKAVLDAGVDVYKTFYMESAAINVQQFKISTWDVGWWQARRALEASGRGNGIFSTLVEAHRELGLKLLPELYANGFLAKAIENEIVEDE